MITSGGQAWRRQGEMYDDGDDASTTAPTGASATAPVAIIGNGPVGQTTALLLARWGIASVILDGRPERDLIGSKAICQQRDVLDVWALVGAGRIAEEGLTWTTARTFYRDQELFSYDMPDDVGSSFPPFVNISQARTEEVLDERIAAQPLIDVRWDHSVEGIDQNDDAVTLRCATASGTRTVTAPYAVACAGAAGSGLRHALGVSFEGNSFDDRFLICDIQAELPGWANERRFYFDPAWNPGRQVLIHPCPDSTFRIDWQVPGDYDLAAEDASGALDDRIQAIIGDVPYEIIWKSVYRFHSRVADQMRVGRVLLAGDCAHLMSPFGARGLNSGVADAENVAWKLAFVLRGWADDALLDTYHAERHAAAMENLQVTTDTMDFLVPHGDAQRRTRVDTLERAARDPQARAEVNSGRFAEPFWYVDSPLTTLDPSRPFAGRPPRGSVPPPGPGILIPDVQVALPESSLEESVATPEVSTLGVSRPGSASGSSVGSEPSGASLESRPHRPSSSGTEPTRLRELARRGLVLLGAAGTDLVAVRAAAAATTAAPARVLDLTEIDDDGRVAGALGIRPGELWVIRPDAHVAAVLTRPTQASVAAALSRVCLPCVT